MLPNTKTTTIDLNNMNEKIRTIEGLSRQTPINMRDLDNRINNVVSTGKDWEIVELECVVVDGEEQGIKYTFPIPIKYKGYNFIIIGYDFPISFSYDENYLIEIGRYNSNYNNPDDISSYNKIEINLNTDYVPNGTIYSERIMDFKYVDFYYSPNCIVDINNYANIKPLSNKITVLFYK